MTGDARDRPFRPVLEALGLLLAPGDVAELRALGRDGRVASGYFDDPAQLAAAVEPMDAAGQYRGIYVTLNPVNPALLARRANRVEPRLGRSDPTTADADIVRRRWLPIDVDPVRPSGVSSTTGEHDAACATVRAIREALAAEGWPAPVVADSGNGGHLLYRVDLPNDDDATALVKGVLAALDERFSTESAKVDTANFNAARIWKCYGTVSRKGDSTTNRPYRRSAIVARPFEPAVVSADQLRALAAFPPAPPERLFAAAAVPAGRFDLRAWLAEHGIAVASEKPWQGGTLYALADCPFSEAHADGAYAIRFPNGAVHVGCKHDSCGGGKQRWQELRARFEPAYAERALPAEPLSHPGDGGTSEMDPAVVAAAKDVLERGDPVRFFLEVFGRDHVGDVVLGHCLVMSIASQTVRNTRGLHVYVTGESGKGKSSGMTAMLRQVPEEFRLAERMSNKALYYSDDITPGTVLLLDDIALSDELQEVLKEATSKFAEPVRMRSVDTDRKVRRYTIPERCVWWLANVSALYDEQVLNRMLVCWVDDSEAQDREVFRRKMEERSRRPGDGGDRFDLLVCREMWRRLRADGLVHVDVPFAGRIRMASVRNRRNPEVLLDLVAGHALVRRFQRACERMGDDGLLVTATEDDFRYAARLFSELHGGGGSLGDKFDRNEQLVLSLAARNGVEQFTLHDLQKWTGWPYHKARRLLLGYESRGLRYPGLLDRSPALTLLDRTTTEDDAEGRGVKQRQFVFLFDAELYRESRPSGLVWLEPGDSEGPGYSNNDCCNTAVTPAVTTEVPQNRPGSENGERSTDFGSSCCSTADHAPQPDTEDMTTARALFSRSAVTRNNDIDNLEVSEESNDDTPANRVTADVAAPVTAVLQQRDCCNSLDPHDFLETADPAFEPCSACGAKPSHYREKRGGEGRLCRRCYGAAVRREQRAGPPLPNAIDAGALHRVAASVGRCDVCGLEAAAWSGGGVRLCEACYRREVRRSVEAGDGAPAEA
ncbi:MAG: hypothetical protein ABFC89_04235 [Methanospirillum sp.]